CIAGGPTLEDHDRKDEQKRDTKQQERDRMCGGIVEFLDFVVERNRSNASDTRDISAEHEHHAKLTNGMGETQSDSCAYTSPRNRKRHIPKHLQEIGPGNTRNLN